MPPRRAAAAAKAAAEAEAPVVKATATKKTTKTTKAAATATAKKPVAVAKTKTATVTKRKRADEEEAVPKTNGVKATTKTAATKAAPTTAAAKRAATAAAKKAKADAVETGANKENDAPVVNGDGKKKRATATTKATKAAKPAAAPAKKAAPKRKAREVEEEESESSEEAEEEEQRPAKVARKTKDTTAPVAAAEAVAKKPVVKIGVKINDAPTKPLDIFVFGEGGAGELGLGSVRFEGKKPMDVKRPRLNHNLSSATVGVVQIAAGGMHAVALTKDNKILTWGVNDQGALGRNTTWDGGLRDADADADSDDGDDDDTGLNPLESTPGEIDTSDVAPGTKFVQVVASDSASFALTEDGRIYGWGTFRASDGVLGFSKDVSIQKTPVLLPEPKKVKALATGSNHILALDAKGKLFTWGCPEQNQLGRRCVQRDIKDSALRPGGVGFKRGVHVEQIACGSYHSFAVDQKGRVYAWGLNNFGQLNVGQGAGDTDAAVLDATLVAGLADFRIVDVDGGEHHSLACTDDGKLLTWGRIDGHQVGLEDDSYNEDNAIFDEHGKPRILKKPTVVPDVPAIAHVNAGTDNSFALTEDGKIFSWGFSGTYQTGQGTTEDVEVPTQIDNTAVRDRKIKYASGGGQFSILASEA